MNKLKVSLLLLIIIIAFQYCKKEETTLSKTYNAVNVTFGNKIDLNNLANYANQAIPTYITKDNTGSNRITNANATLGRVLFYDKNLSINNTISCSSCHIQAFAFGDTALASEGVLNGTTARHSMRLVNARFGIESKFFWNERAISLEAQTTQPVQDHAEMGFSGQAGRPTIDSLIRKLASIDYYKELFQFVYNDTIVTEVRLQECLAQFVRSIQSFDSKYDAGRIQVSNDNQNFPNFTQQENMGKNLFLLPPVFDATGNRTAGGLGCNGCHNAPEFDIAPDAGNNGIIGVLNGAGIDIDNTRAPSLRNITGIDGNPNTPMMHTGVIKTLQAAIGHYGTINIAPGNTKLDPKLTPNGFGQQLHLTGAEVDAVIAFLKTLSGTNVYTDAKWSNPF